MVFSVQPANSQVKSNVLNQQQDSTVIYLGRGEAYDWNGWENKCTIRVELEETTTHLNFRQLAIDCGALTKTGRSIRLKKVDANLVSEDGEMVGTWGASWAKFDLSSVSTKITERIQIQKRFGYVEYREDWFSEAEGEWYFTLSGEMSPLF